MKIKIRKICHYLTYVMIGLGLFVPFFNVIMLTLLVGNYTVDNNWREQETAGAVLFAAAIGVVISILMIGGRCHG